MSDYKKQMLALQKPLKPDRVIWRIQQANTKGDKPWALVLAYMDNRAVQERFDEVFGIDGWKNEYKTAPDGGTLCGISVKFDNEWVTKWDGAENTQVEAVKGGLSGSMKRAAVQWGVGRYLYDLETSFVPLSTRKDNQAQRHYDKTTNTNYYWFPPQLPAWALPEQKTEKKTTKTNQKKPPVPKPSKLYKTKNKLGETVEVNEATMKSIVERMVARAGQESGATIEDQQMWLNMPLDEAYSDIEKFVKIKNGEKNDK